MSRINVNILKRSQPPWFRPDDSDTPRLKLYNSLTRSKEIFIPESGRNVSWYSCGPTVYDAAHMGHARSYISFDILRRILSEYFSYDVFYVMNITDIDDKIIRRARQKYLYDAYINQEHDLTKVIEDVRNAVSMFEKQIAIQEDVDKKVMQERLLVKTKDTLGNTENIRCSKGPEDHIPAKNKLLKEAKDVICDWLDVVQGKEVCDNSVFADLPAKFEEAFHRDMASLNVRPPDAVTRVSEYIPEIVCFVEKIIENGLAYESNGSVYFDTITFDNLPKHTYGKLVPEAFGDLKKLHEGEGDLSISEERLREKKSASDFAVWKASKPGEPSWDSPWGKGRPGWHIECSVMASALLGKSMDIHTGGYDLKFPHHDNELAQSEAHFKTDGWVNYFLHSGHLTISGCKMSKSLKNFITIEDALKEYSARQLRFAFLLHSWKDTLDYSTRTMDMAIHYEKLIMEFFLNVKDSIRNQPTEGRVAFTKWLDEEHKLNAKFKTEQAGVHEALCDNVDTRHALDHIRDLVTACNIYIREKRLNMSLCNQLLLRNIASYVSRILKIFGTMEDSSSFGFSSDKGAEATNVENAVMPHLNVLANFRENVRQKAKEIKASSILKLCDDLRDEILPDLGVRLEDQEGLQPVIKLVDRDELRQEIALKQKVEAEKNLEKIKKKKELEEIQAAKEAQKRIPPFEIFKSQTDKYSIFDEKGIPTHDVAGKELSKMQVKKILKIYQAQEKKYNEYLKGQEAADVINGQL